MYEFPVKIAQFSLQREPVDFSSFHGCLFLLYFNVCDFRVGNVAEDYLRCSSRPPTEITLVAGIIMRGEIEEVR